MSEEMLRKLADKLSVHSSKAIQKASEYYRLCTTKSMLGLSKVSDSAKICVVLHIASEELAVPIDKTQAIKLSCLTKPAYLKLVHTFKSLLNGGTQLTVASLCSDLGIPELTQTTQELLNKLKRATIDRNHLKENCRVKWTTVQKLSVEMLELWKSSSEGRKKRKIGLDPSAIAASIEKKSCQFNGISKEPANGNPEPDPEDEYESWKRRILEQASL